MVFRNVVILLFPLRLKNITKIKISEIERFNLITNENLKADNFY